MTEKFRRIAVVGGIAVGKSTMVEALSNRLENCQVILEDVSQNIFLEDFYEDMFRWGFHSRISTLSMITANYLSCNTQKYKCAIFDRCVDELITFAQMHYERGNMSQKEFSVYKSLYYSIISIAPPIDLFIYCKCSPQTSLERIRKRNRSFEQSINVSYLIDLNTHYENWLNTVDIRRVEVVDTNTALDYKQIESIIMRHI